MTLTPPPLLDPYRTAFDLAPVGMVLSRERTMVDCNREVLAMFRAQPEQLVGQSFAVLYPSPDEYERTGQRIVDQMDAEGRYADERVMRRLNGELFWCHVVGRVLDPSRAHEAGIWTFEDLSDKRPMSLDFTKREREIAALLVRGLTSKLIGRELGISPRTVEVFRARLMRKTQAATTAELVNKLLSV